MAACPLSSAIATALGRHRSWLALGPRALALGLPDLDLSLPALPANGTAPALSEAQIRAYAALYYYGELETTGLMEIAELLAEERDTLGIRDAALYRALDTLWSAMRSEWYPTERRQMIFARMLGLGEASGIQAGLAGLARTISGFEEALRYGGRVDAGMAARLDMSGQAVLRVIGTRAAMGLERAAMLLNGQTRKAIDVLQNPALHRRVGARDMWGFLQAVAAPVEGPLPDLGRAVRRAQSGSVLIAALASARAPGGLAALLHRDHSVMVAAADWQMHAPRGFVQTAPAPYGHHAPYGHSSPFGLRPGLPRRDGGGWA
jgi:hypothetical protein